MSVVIKRILLGFLITIITYSVVSFVSAEEDSIPVITRTTNEELTFTQGSFAQLDDKTIIPSEDFIALLESDELVLENNRFELYLNEETLAFKLRNKQTGYVWNSVIDDVDAGTFNGLLSSSIGFEYINIDQNYTTRQNIGILDTEFDATVAIANQKVSVELSINGFCTSRQCNQFYEEYVAGNPRYDLDRMITLGFVNLGFKVPFTVELTEDGLHVHVAFDEIEQANGESIVLSSLMIFPGLGATTLDRTPGYMVIPDGMGALIRYQDNAGQFVAAYDERFYGDDDGIVSSRRSVTNQRLLMPMYGVVHGVDQHAMLASIIQGDLSARLIAIPAGANNIPYNVVYPKYEFNQTFLQSFTSDGLGGVQKIHSTSTSDIEVLYEFLDGDQANYVGIGRAYREQLISAGVLSSIDGNEDSIPLHTKIIMADSRNQFIGKSTIVMTTTEEAASILDQLSSNNITHQHVSLMGWNRGGYSGRLPSPVRFASAVGSEAEFTSLFSSFPDTRFYLRNNYIHTNPENGRIRYRQDVALGVNQFRLIEECFSCVYPDTYLLYPQTSLRLALNDYLGVEEFGVHVLFEELGATLFSVSRNNQSIPRETSLEDYVAIMQTYQGQAAFLTPNAYAWSYTNTYFDAPLFHSQLKIFDDTVPLLSIVLAGSMDIFSKDLNFNSAGQTHLLKMIDYHVYPSYVVTQERSSTLKGSDIEQYYATQFASWEPTIVDDYEFINEALRHVYGAQMTNREVVASDVVITTYDNQVQIIINYNEDPVTINDMVVEGLSYHVIGGTSS